MSHLELGKLTPAIIQELEQKYLSMVHTNEHIQFVKDKCNELDSQHGFAD